MSERARVFSEWLSTTAATTTEEKSQGFHSRVMTLAHRCCAAVEDALRWVSDASDGEYDAVSAGWQAAWVRAGDAVMCFMCSHHRLFYRVRRYKSSDCRVDTEARVSDVLYLLYLKCLMCACGARLFASPPYRDMVAKDMPHLTGRGIIRSSLPFRDYNTRSVMDSLLQLDSVWLSLAYHAQLVRYLQLLEYRAAELLMRPHSSRFCNLPLYRDALSPDSYCANWRFLSDVALYALNMHRSIMVYQAVPAAPRVALLKTFAAQLGVGEERIRECAARVAAGIRAIAATVRQETLEESFTRNFMALSCRPSEVESFLRMNTEGKRTGRYNIMDPAKIMAACRGGIECNRAIEAAQMSATAALDVPETVCPIAAPLMALCLLEKAFVGNSSVRLSTLLYYRNFIAYTFDRHHSNIDKIRSTRLPLLVQTFNHFVFCWNNVQYECEGFSEAAACVLIVLAHAHSAKLDHQDLSATFHVVVGEDWKRVMGVV